MLTVMLTLSLMAEAWQGGYFGERYYNLDPQIQPTYLVIWGVILGLYRGYIGIMENNLETTI